MMFTLPESAGGIHTLTVVQDPSVVGFKIHPGDHGGGVTPVPIPNTAVKPSSADGTARVAWWESRTLPGFFLISAPRWRHRGFFLLRNTPSGL